MSDNFMRIRKGLIVTPTTSIPTSSVDGAILFDDNEKKFKRWDSTTNSWVPMGEGGGGGGGGFGNIVTPPSYPYSAPTQNSVILVDTTSPKTINLPSASANNNLVLTFIDANGLSATNNITLSPTGGSNIMGLTSSYILRSNFGSWTFIAIAASNSWRLIL
jgi:hypothetical protein